MSGRKATVVLLLLGGLFPPGCHDECFDDEDPFACEILYTIGDVINAALDDGGGGDEGVAVVVTGPGAPETPRLLGPGLLAIDLLDGGRSVLSDDLTGGPLFLDPRAAAMDEGGDRVLVWDRGRRAILEVDAERGGRRVLPTGASFLDVSAMIVADDALVVVEAGGVVRVDLATGATEWVTEAGAFADAAAIAFDPKAHRFLVGDGDAVFAVDPPTGARTFLSGAGRGDGPGFSDAIDALAFDAWRDELIVHDRSGEVYAVDPVAGDRTRLFDLDGAVGLAVTPFELLLVQHAGLYARDPAGGAGAWISIGGIGTGPLPRRPLAVLYDPQRDRALVLDLG